MSLENKVNAVAFHYVKTNDYRTIGATGAIGGITGQGEIHMNFYTDRPAIPRKAVYRIDDSAAGEQKLGELIELDIKEGGIREIQFGATFSVQTGKEIIDWITQQIQIIEGFQKGNK